MIGALIIGIFWAAMSLLVMIEYAPHCKELNDGDKIIVSIIFIIGGPIFTIANVLEAILDCYMPEGWGDSGGCQ